MLLQNRSRNQLAPVALSAAFVLLAAVIFGIEARVVVPSTAFQAHPDRLSLAILFDLIVFVPLLCGALVLRPRRLSPWLLVPVLNLCLMGAALVLPPSSRHYVQACRYLLAPLEMSVTGYALWRLVRTARRGIAAGCADAAAPAADRIESALTGALGKQHPAAILLAAELTTLYYGLFAWRCPTPPATPTTFTCYRNCGWTGLVAGILVMMLFEGVAEHLLVQMWSPRLAWTLTAFGLYGALWLLADLNALRLHPIQLRGDVLEITIGLRWRVTVPLSQIAEVREAKAHPKRRVPGYLKAVVFGPPNRRLHLTAPIEARGPLGLRREARWIALSLDAPEAFDRALHEAREARREPVP